MKMISSSLYVIAFAVMLLSCKTESEKDGSAETNVNMEEKETFNDAKTLNEHLALTQYYRWYQLYERDITEPRIENSMDILADDLYMKTSAGEMNGKTDYPERVKVYKSWQNAHHVQNVSVTENEDGTLGLKADIRYQNIKPDGETAAYTINYDTTLEKRAGDFPLFKSITLTPTGEIDDEFKDAYPTNRMRSLLHAWIANIEQLGTETKPFLELLIDDFLLNFSSGPIHNEAELAGWLQDAPSQLKQSSHHPENFSVKELGDNLYEVNVEFDWYGITKDDKKMRARTSHTWTVKDGVNERFARIQNMEVEVKEPFRVVE